MTFTMEQAKALVQNMAVHAGDNILMRDGATALNEFRSELMTCRNELCLRCGSYKESHLGACDGCRWKVM